MATFGSGGSSSVDGAPLPPSGLLDPPLVWPVPPPPAAAGGDGAAAPAAAAHVVVGGGGGARPHVSLHALWDALTAFSKRNADVVVRAWASALLFEAPAPDAVAAALAGADEAAYGHLGSTVLCGSHSALEVVVTSMADAGAHTELLASAEGRRHALLVERVLVPLLRQLLLSRLRLRRRLDTHLRDLAAMVADAEGVDSYYSWYLDMRCDEAAAAWRAAHGAKERDAATRAAIAALPALPAPDHRHLHLLRASLGTGAMLPWALDLALRAMLLFLDIGAEDGLYAADELASVYWYSDYLLALLLRQTRALIAGAAVRASLPELCRVTAETAAALSAGTCTLLARSSPLLKPVLERGLEGGGGDAAGTGAGAGGGGGGGGGRRGRKDPAKSERRRETEAGVVEGQLRELTAEWESALATPPPGARLFGAVPVYTRRLDMLALQTHQCKAQLRLHFALVLARLTHGMPARDGGASARAGPFFRDSAHAFARRFVAFAPFAVPKPLTYDDFQASFSNDDGNGGVAVARVLADARRQHAVLAEFARRAVTHARACLAGDAAAVRIVPPPPDRGREASVAMVERAVASGMQVAQAEIMKLQEPVPATAADVRSAADDLANALRWLRVARTNDVFLAAAEDALVAAATAAASPATTAAAASPPRVEEPPAGLLCWDTDRLYPTLKWAAPLPAAAAAPPPSTS